MLYLIQRWSESFMRKHSGFSVYAEGGGSHTGIQALINGSVEICAASRQWLPAEIKALVDKQGALGISILTARDALSIYLHPLNPIKNLSREQIRDIYSGRISNWKEVGGNDATITILTRNPNSGTHLFFERHLLQNEHYRDDVVVLPSTNSIIKYVRSNPSAIGYGGMAYGDELYHCSIDGVEPSRENVRNGTYPIARYLYLYTVRSPEGAIKTFIDWVLSPDGQTIVNEVGYIPLYE